VVRQGSSVQLYENGRLKLAQGLSGIKAYGGATQIGAGTCFDIRRNLRAISADAMYNYYESILRGDGSFLP
jgi:hypothetical protein